MIAAFWLTFAVFIIALCYSIYRILISPEAKGWLRVVFVGLLLLSGGAAYWLTYKYQYFPNGNTRVYGWPIPWIVFQRHSPNDPFLDFVGPTYLLALPMNFLLFTLPISLTFLILLWVFPALRMQNVSKQGTEVNP